jgi:hypothetical protein
LGCDTSYAGTGVAEPLIISQRLKEDDLLFGFLLPLKLRTYWTYKDYETFLFTICFDPLFLYLIFSQCSTVPSPLNHAYRIPLYHY